MANGKGSLDCCYCVHSHGTRSVYSGPGECAKHNVCLPTTHFNIVCVHFEPNEDYWKSNSRDTTPVVRFSWFGEKLQAGLLYVFGYNTPERIEERVEIISLPKRVN